MIIGIGSDHGGFELKEEMKKTKLFKKLPKSFLIRLYH